MRTLDKIVLTLIGIGISLFGVGCQSTRVTKENLAGPPPILQKHVPSSDIRIRSRPIGNDKNIDELIGASEEYIDYIKFRKEYGEYEKKIMANINNSNYDTANRLVRELKGKLENDKSIYAKEYLGKISNFNYIVIEAYKENKEVTKVGEGPVTNVFSGISAVGSAPIWVPITVSVDVIDTVGRLFNNKAKPINCTGEALNIFFPEVKEKETKQFYNMVRIDPYLGKRQTIANKVPYEKLENELRKYQNAGNQR